MSVVRPEELTRLAREAAVRICWAQWVGLGSPASPTGTRSPRSMIDVEALLIATLVLSEEERRLHDMAAWWARVGSHLTSVQRFRSLGGRFSGDEAKMSLEAFAAMAAASGDKRWRRYAGPSVPHTERPPKGLKKPGLLEDCALWPRLRAGFGVGAKADILAFLLGLGGSWATSKSIAFGTGYSSVSVRKAAEEMALARLIRVTPGRPMEYRAPPRPWGDLLDLGPGRLASEGDGGLPRWRFWAEVLSILLEVAVWSGLQASDPEGNPYVVASKARDILERHQNGLTLSGVPIPPPAAFPGLEAPEGLAETTRVLSRWIQEVI